MNKKEFIKALSKKINLDEEVCEKISNILEKHNIIGRKGKEEIKEELQKELNLDVNEADNIYNESMSLITSEIKNKIIHPFKK